MNKKLLNKIKDRIISIDSSLLDALKQMDKIEKKLLLVFDKNKFINVLSIGDIQRAILKNISLTSSVRFILRKDTAIAHSKEIKNEIYKRMSKERIECMPVVNEKNVLVDVIFWEDIPSKLSASNNKINLPVVIMAGGTGERLKPITNILPKPLFPIGKKTILEHIIDSFSNAGCSDFYISLNYKSEIIEQYMKSIDSSGYNLTFFKEDKPLGTAGSLHLLHKKIDSTFFVTNCDILINEDYYSIYNYHRRNCNELTIVSALKYLSIPYGIIQTKKNGVLKEISEKPEIVYQINSGMYILEPNLLKEIPSNRFFHITDLIEKVHKRKGKVGVFPVSEGSWSDIGSWTEYLKKIKNVE